MKLSLLVAATSLLGIVTAVPEYSKTTSKTVSKTASKTTSKAPSKTSSAPQETCSSIVVDSITIEDATLVCCSNLALSVDNIATGVGTGCVEADYTKYATKGDCAGKPAIAACCDIPVGDSLGALGGLQLLCAHAEAA